MLFRGLVWVTLAFCSLLFLALGFTDEERCEGKRGGCTDADYDDYDMVIDIADLDAIAAEQQINVSIKGAGDTFKKKVAGFADKASQTTLDARIFGIVGLFNKGKSWFINNAFCKDKSTKSYRSGTKFTTRGISLAYIEKSDCGEGVGDQWLIMDTAGTQSTIAYKNMKGKSRVEMELEKIAKQYMLEDFIFDLVTKVSDVLVFMVNDFTWLEQRIAHDLTDKMRSDCYQKAGLQVGGKQMRCQDRDFIVAHNFKYTTTKDECAHLFTTQVADIDEGIEDNIGEDLELKADFRHTTHIAFMNDRSSEGKEINKRQFAKVRERMRLAAVPEPFAFEELLPLHRVIHNLIKCIPKDKSSEKRGPEDFETSLASDGSSIHIDDVQECKLAQMGVLDPAGDDGVAVEAQTRSLFKSVYIPSNGKDPYTYGSWNHLLVYQIDVPGVTKNDVTFSANKAQEWKVTIERKMHYMMRDEDGNPLELKTDGISYDKKDALKGKVWPAPGSNIINQTYTKTVNLDSFSPAHGYKFDAWMNPSKRCLKKLAANKATRKLCSPWTIKRGILFIVGRTLRELDPSTGKKEESKEPGSRRREQKWY